MDQAEPYPEGKPERRRPDEDRPRERPRADKRQGPAPARPIGVVHPVVVGYDGSDSARNALASVKKWGGEVSDYLPLHSWFDVIWTGKSFQQVL